MKTENTRDSSLREDDNKIDRYSPFPTESMERHVELLMGRTDLKIKPFKLNNMEEGAKQTRKILNSKEVVDQFVGHLFNHDASTQSAILDEVKDVLISDYSRRRDNNLKDVEELEHAIHVLRCDIPMTTASTEDRGDVFVERKNYR